jgi:hypothetical protein
VLIAMLFTGPLAGYLTRRRETRAAAPATPAPPVSAPTPSPDLLAPPTLARTSQPTSQPTSLPRIVRLKEDSTTVLSTPPSQDAAAPTAALRIQRRERSSEPTIALPTPPEDEGGQATQAWPAT